MHFSDLFLMELNSLNILFVNSLIPMCYAENCMLSVNEIRNTEVIIISHTHTALKKKNIYY